MNKKIVQWIVCFNFILFFQFAKGTDLQPSPKITPEKVAVLLVKHSGIFDRYVPVKADVKWCISFLKKLGIQLYLQESSAKKEFTQKDMARVLGQIELLLSGKATYANGYIQLPDLTKSWEEFCAINQIEYKNVYKGMCGA